MTNVQVNWKPFDYLEGHKRRVLSTLIRETSGFKKREGETLYIGESSNCATVNCDGSKLCSRDTRIMLLHLTLKVSSFQNGAEAATDKGHIQESQWESKTNKQKPGWYEKEVHTLFHSTASELGRSALGSLSPCFQMGDCHIPGKSSGTRLSLHKIFSSDCASASETAVIVSLIISCMFRCSIKSVFTFGIYSFK